MSALHRTRRPHRRAGGPLAALRARLPGGLLRRCKWRRQGFRPNTRFAHWVCVRCAAGAYTRDARPPRTCQRHNREAQL